MLKVDLNIDPIEPPADRTDIKLFKMCHVSAMIYNFYGVDRGTHP